MQPCSQPRYGLMDRSNGKSGEVLRVMMVLAVSIRTSVPWVGGTSWYQPSSSATLTVGAKRLCRLVAVPRPRGGSAVDMKTPRYCFYIQYRGAKLLTSAVGRPANLSVLLRHLPQVIARGGVQIVFAQIRHIARLDRCALVAPTATDKTDHIRHFLVRQTPGKRRHEIGRASC